MSGNGGTSWLRTLSEPLVFLLAAAVLVIVALGDYVTGIDVNFTFFYLIPVALVTWRIGRQAGIVASLVCALVWAVTDVVGRPEFNAGLAVWNTWIQFGVFVTFSFISFRIFDSLSNQRKLNTELQTALAEVKKLSGLLPVCAWCRRVRDEHDHWMSLEAYVMEHSETDFTHGICPDCRERRERERAMGQG